MYEAEPYCSEPSKIEARAADARVAIAVQLVAVQSTGGWPLAPRGQVAQAGHSHPRTSRVGPLRSRHRLDGPARSALLQPAVDAPRQDRCHRRAIDQSGAPARAGEADCYAPRGGLTRRGGGQCRGARGPGLPEWTRRVRSGRRERAAPVARGRADRSDRAGARAGPALAQRVRAPADRVAVRRAAARQVSVQGWSLEYSWALRSNKCSHARTLA